jgi:hypothetical protein
VGQQKYIIAYTLKQGVEKQPDILNAQKPNHSNSAQSMRDVQIISSTSPSSVPATTTLIRPDALFTQKQDFKPQQYYATTNFDPSNSTSSSRQSTLKRNEMKKINVPNYLENLSSLQLYNASLIQTTSATSLHQQPQPQQQQPPYSLEQLNNKNHNHIHNSSSFEHSYPLGVGVAPTTIAATLPPTHTSNFNNFHSHPNNPDSDSEHQHQQHHHADYERNTIDNNRLLNKINLDVDNESIKTNLNVNYLSNGTTINSTAAHSNATKRYSGSDFFNHSPTVAVSETMANNDYHQQLLGTNSVAKNRNRSHIITDTLPGPESCV